MNMSTDVSNKLTDYYLPPQDGFILESMVATTFEVDFEFFEEDLLAIALGVRSPISRLKAFRSEIDRKLQTTEITILYDPSGCDKLARLSPRIDLIPITTQKLHSKISLLMWVRPGKNSRATDRYMRLVIGSANITRPGFRENYECASVIDYSGRNSSSPTIMNDAIKLIKKISPVPMSPQLNNQLNSFEEHMIRISQERINDDGPLKLITADEVLLGIRDAWMNLSVSRPNKLTIASPFWPEGKTAVDALVDIIHSLGSPDHVELICRGAPGLDGKGWLPEFDAELACALKNRLSSKIYLRPAIPDYGVVDSYGKGEEHDDEVEDVIPTDRVGNAIVHRILHAKMILVENEAGGVLYIGSSNCTRRGLDLGGPVNFEAGILYQIMPHQLKWTEELFGFAGSPTEVLPDQLPPTNKPEREEERPFPRFISEIVAIDTEITISFKDAMIIPEDLVMLMDVPFSGYNPIYWVLLNNNIHVINNHQLTVDLKLCSHCDDNLKMIQYDNKNETINPGISVKVTWAGHSAMFPVRFDDKTRLPLLHLHRKPTEQELIDYFLHGREPEDSGGGGGHKEDGNGGNRTDDPIDTSNILSYFIRRFVQAIPGIEAEIERASYSRAALESTLRGPTSPLELADRAYLSLEKEPAPFEPKKTPTAVGFQLVEIIAVLMRCRDKTNHPELQVCFDIVISRCKEMIDAIRNKYPELSNGSFDLYYKQLLRIL